MSARTLPEEEERRRYEAALKASGLDELPVLDAGPLMPWWRPIPLEPQKRKSGKKKERVA